jgi:EAL domain-containing protein (putative c-di-GMP-specific phosphodiesterase class I)
MGIQTVAEYVEDQATVDALTALGLDYGQGNHFAAAQPLAALCDELTERLVA